ncbi:hypothetical protein GL50803_009363 [Giardia duodenalis]|uniref:Uncharacterized protein n=1 Tax=Giardia intestinalis (strain ATCC 50803 / WB clone C6) TaxID=184922 RepID=A8B508_GIAIC|nr:hypothetical protein GL50803_009363 [Giardia intestinalis]KAE8303816.1 hypothetical protein GL50803_009363 [Giardia intestinalis]|eukprot:XP_001709744.1 Hypothetical protein GL50803_9363 [Giardia lamblia ATCC 50803]
MLNLIPPRSFVLQETIQEITGLVAHAQELTTLYFKALCDFHVLFPLLQDIRSVVAQISALSSTVPLAMDGVVACCVSSVLACLKRVIEATVTIGESCLSAITPTWQWNDHIYEVLHSAYVQTVLAVNAARFKHIYSTLPLSTSLTVNSLYIIICIFWENTIGYRPTAPASEVLSSLLNWLDARGYYDKSTSINKTEKSRDSFLADITGAVPNSAVTPNDLFCYAHIFNYFLYESLCTNLPGVSLESHLYELVKEARLTFMDNVFPGILPLTNVTNQSYINPCYNLPSFDTFWLQFDLSAYSKSSLPLAIAFPRPEFIKDTVRFSEESVLLNEEYIKISNCHVLVQKLKLKLKPIDDAHDSTLSKVYTDRATKLQDLYASITQKLNGVDATNISSIQDRYLANLIILRQLSFCYLPSDLKHEHLSYYTSRLPVPILDLGIISVPYLAEYLFHILRHKSPTESPIGIPADFVTHVCGTRVFSDTAPSVGTRPPQKDTIEYLLFCLNQIHPHKGLHIDLHADEHLRTNVVPSNSGRDYELSQTLLRTVNGTPILIQRYMERECKKAMLSNKIKLTAMKLHQVHLLVKQSIDSVISDCVDSIKTHNTTYKHMTKEDIIQELFSASEIEGYEMLTKEKSIGDEKPTEPDKLNKLNDHVSFIVSKMITICLNTAIICGSEFDKELTKITGCILPFGGLSCRLTMSYLNKLYNRYSSISEHLTEGVMGAISSLWEIVAAKTGYSSGALDRILVYRGLHIKQSAITSPELILPSICKKDDSRLNYHSSRFRDELLATCSGRKECDSPYLGGGPEFHLHRKTQENEYFKGHRGRVLYHEAGYLPLRTFSLAMVQMASNLKFTIYNDLSLLIFMFKHLPISLSRSILICQLYSQAVLNIPKILSASIACTELLKLKLHPSTTTSYMSAFPLQESFCVKGRELLDKQSIVPALLSDLNQLKFNIVVSGTPGSGVTTLIKYLTLSPLFQYIEPLSSAAGEPILFMESHMVSTDNNADRLPWYFNAEQHARRILAKRNSTKDSLSIGSWLSCDSGCRSTSSAEKTESVQKQVEKEEVSAKDRTDTVICQLLQEIKGISLVSGALDLFNIGLDDELKVAMEGGKNIYEYDENGTAIVTYNHVAINDNSLFVATPPKQVSYSQSNGLETCGGYSNFMSLFNTEATDFRPKGLIDYDSSSDYVFHNRYVGDEAADSFSANAQAIKLSDRFDQAVASLPTVLHADIFKEIERAGNKQAEKDVHSYATGKEATQVLRKKLPLIDFKMIRHASTLEPMEHSIDLLPFYSGIKLNFIDVPPLYAFPGARLNATNGCTTEEQTREDLEKLEKNLETSVARQSSMHAELLTAVQAIHSMFMPPGPSYVPSANQIFISPEFLAAQRETATALVNPQTRQIQATALERLIAIVSEQHTRASQQFVAENTVIEQFVATLKVQYDKLSLENPPQQHLVDEYNRQRQLLETRRTVGISIRNLVDNLNKELITLQRIKALSSTILSVDTEIQASKQKIAQARAMQSVTRDTANQINPVHLEQIGTLISNAELFIYVYDCTSSIHQFGVDQQVVESLASSSLSQTCTPLYRYVPESVYSDQVITMSSIYQRLSAIGATVPGIIVCNKCDNLVINGSIKTLCFGLRLAELLDWPHIFASSRTGAFINSVLRPVILQKTRSIAGILEAYGDSIANIYSTPFPLPNVIPAAVPEFLSLLTDH